MQKHVSVALAGLAAFTAAAALGQGGIDRRLASAKRIECTFSVIATGTWDMIVTSIGV
jgi:hypothetical protein